MNRHKVRHLIRQQLRKVVRQMKRDKCHGRMRAAIRAAIYGCFITSLFLSCATQRYDSQGNGTWPIDKAELQLSRWINHEHQ